MSKIKNPKFSGRPLKVSTLGVDQRQLFGQRGAYLKEIELEFPVKIVARGDEIQIYGEKEPSQLVKELFNDIIQHLASGGSISEQTLQYAMKMVKGEKDSQPSLDDDRILMTNRRIAIRPRSDGQKKYMDAIFSSDLVFAIGPAGTGKTYLAVACAVRFLKERRIDRIILVRPAVETDEQLGFLPGDMKEKVDPYLRPLYDALYDMLPRGQVDRHIETGVIEIAPLAFMRGRTLNNSFIILDEAQNTTVRQMKMFLTRLGMNSKTVVTGDITQIDLQDKSMSGLLSARSILDGITGIEFVYLSDKDVVRHPLVQEIILAYDKWEKKEDN
ncbi:phosphate starvation-inducible protein PhoH [bacterium]|nr:MAG: phosphate starvation-inducible protein PhoH [bacterium]